MRVERVDRVGAELALDDRDHPPVARDGPRGVAEGGVGGRQGVLDLGDDDAVGAVELGRQRAGAIEVALGAREVAEGGERAAEVGQHRDAERIAVAADDRQRAATRSLRLGVATLPELEATKVWAFQVPTS